MSAYTPWYITFGRWFSLLPLLVLGIKLRPSSVWQSKGFYPRVTSPGGCLTGGRHTGRLPHWLHKHPRARIDSQSSESTSELTGAYLGDSCRVSSHLWSSLFRCPEVEGFSPLRHRRGMAAEPGGAWSQCVSVAPSSSLNHGKFLQLQVTLHVQFLQTDSLPIHSSIEENPWTKHFSLTNSYI